MNPVKKDWEGVDKSDWQDANGKKMFPAFMMPFRKTAWICRLYVAEARRNQAESQDI